MKLAQLRQWARGQLAPKLDQQLAALETDVYLARILGVSRAAVLASAEREITQAQQARLEEFVERRLRHEPFAYITGEKEFFGRPFLVNRAVLIPRPDTELLVERTLCCFEPSGPESLLIDVGVGSGAVVLSVVAEILERFGSKELSRHLFIGLDLSGAALKVARQNAVRLELEQFVSFVQGDCLGAFGALARRPLIVSNPPYIPESLKLAPEIELYEPRLALRAGERGLDVLKKLFNEASTLLAGGGKALVEIGADERVDVELLLNQTHISQVVFYQDLAARDRVVEVTCGSIFP